MELKRLWPICDVYFYQRFPKVDSPGLGGVVDVLDSTGGSFGVYDSFKYALTLPKILSFLSENGLQKYSILFSENIVL